MEKKGGRFRYISMNRSQESLVTLETKGGLALSEKTVRASVTCCNIGRRKSKSQVNFVKTKNQVRGFLCLLEIQLNRNRTQLPVSRLP